MDALSIGAGLAGASHFTNIVKALTGALKDAGKAEAIGQVIELQMLVSDLIEKNRGLADQNRELHAKLDLKAKMTFRKPFWFQEGDEQAHCPNCWESTGKPIHLTDAVQ